MAQIPMKYNGPQIPHGIHMDFEAEYTQIHNDIRVKFHSVYGALMFLIDHRTEFPNDQT